MQPAIRYRGNHFVGYAVDQQDKAARTVIALMVAPLMGAPAFVARLIPLYSFSADLLFDQIVKLIEIIHDCPGFVFLVMSDNLRANQKCFKLFHDT